MEQNEFETLIEKLYNALIQLKISGVCSFEQFDEIYAKCYRVVEEINYIRLMKHIYK